MTYTLTILKWRIGPPSFFLYSKGVCIAVRGGGILPVSRLKSEKTIAKIKAETKEIALTKARVYVEMLS